MHGGQRIEVRVRFRAEAALNAPSVCLMVRNRMAQLLFGARSALAAPLPPGAEAEARFAFVLPYMPSGEYVLAPLVLDGDDAQRVVLRPEAVVMPVSTVHFSQGLANVRMRAVEIERSQTPQEA